MTKGNLGMSRYYSRLLALRKYWRITLVTIRYSEEGFTEIKAIDAGILKQSEAKF